MTALVLAAALLLDAILGEPRWLWFRLIHPVVLIGRMIGWLDRMLNHGSAGHLRGATALLAVLLVVGMISALPQFMPYGWLLEILIAAVLLAQRSLADHVHAVARGLRQDLQTGRQAVSRIVGRDPNALDEAGVGRAAIESAAENFSDAVVAPAFWFAVAGLPGIALYKAINTADSMIGHRTPRYQRFGWAAARLDDLVNLIPARLAGLLLCLVGGGLQAMRVMVRDAPKHRSPNAGWPEAAMAAALGVALAGPRAYAGEAAVNDAFIHLEGRHAITPEDIDAGVALLWRGWAVILAGCLVAAWLSL